MNAQQLENKCIALVKTHIKGTRQSNNLPAYIHSLRVYEILKDARCDFHTQIAGLLHDILEDTSLSSQELLQL
jgi:GTP pyrophosphokinase